MGLSYNVYLSSSRIYMCKSCKTHLSNHEDIISRVSSAPQACEFLLHAVSPCYMHVCGTLRA